MEKMDNSGYVNDNFQCVQETDRERRIRELADEQIHLIKEHWKKVDEWNKLPFYKKIFKRNPQYSENRYNR